MARTTVDLFISTDIFFTEHPLDYPDIEKLWSITALHQFKLLQSTFPKNSTYIIQKSTPVITRALTFNYSYFITDLPRNLSKPYLVVDTDYIRWMRLPTENVVICRTFYGFTQELYSKSCEKITKQFKQLITN